MWTPEQLLDGTTRCRGGVEARLAVEIADGVEAHADGPYAPLPSDAHRAAQCAQHTATGRVLSTWVRAVGAPHLLARADSNGELGRGEEVQGMRG